VVRIGSQDFVIIAMDHLPDGTITKLANPSRFIPLPEVIRLGMDVLRGLEYLHEENFFHNDVKPENVLIGSQGQGMLSDYGIVGISADGSPVPPLNSYKIHAAPEVVNNHGITAQIDIFQTGLTFFRMLVGLDTLRQKFISLGEQDYYDAICRAKLVTAADFPAFIPPRIRRIVLKALSPDLSERYSSALEMRRDLEKLNYSCYWTIEPSGAFVGHGLASEFRFDQIKKPGGKFDVIAFKKSKATQRKTRFSRFCADGLTNAESKKQISRFVKAVVEGV
jgi:eukaryotic-like serine/threonine-protein kinase